MAGTDRNILIIDDDVSISRSLRLIFEKTGYNAEVAKSAEIAKNKVKNGNFHIALIDIILPDIDGVSLLGSLKKIEPGLKCIIITGFASIETAVGALNKGAAAYLTKPLNMDEVIITIREIFERLDLEEEKIQAEEELRQSNITLRKTLDGIMNTLEAIIEIKDPYTSGHQKRVALLVEAISKELGMNEEEIDTLKTIVMIHDIGKISIPVSILSKPGPLSKLEYDMIRTHPQVGYDILKEIEFPWPITDIVLQHHERLNGSGYPQGLKRKDIMFEAKVLAVADVVEAMTSYRPYRPAFDLEDAVREITKGRGRLYDLKVVDACIRVIDGKKFKF